MARACGHSFAGIAGSNPCPGHGCLCCVLYSKDKGKSQDNHDKETSTEKIQRENKRRNSKHNPGVGEIFWPWGPPNFLYNGHRVSFGRGVVLTAHPHLATRLKKV